jgi:putative spermidine/putrescine transport system ATP-binding protein
MEMWDRVGLAAFAARRPCELSGGQQQRVALARALVFEPDALLLDEPLGALDRKLREQLQIEIKDIQRRVGISILYVTHDQDEAMMMSDRIAVMTDGEIVQIGTPSDVYLHPDTPFVAGFLGETNLLPVSFQGIENGHAVVRYPNGMVGHARLPHTGKLPQNGDQALVSLRPERISFMREGTSQIEGTVSAHSFLGRHARSVVQAMGQAIVVSTTEVMPMTLGKDVGLGWTDDDAQLLAGDGSIKKTGG